MVDDAGIPASGAVPRFASDFPAPVAEATGEPGVFLVRGIERDPPEVFVFRGGVLRAYAVRMIDGVGRVVVPSLGGCAITSRNADPIAEHFVRVERLDAAAPPRDVPFAAQPSGPPLAVDEDLPCGRYRAALYRVAPEALRLVAPPRDFEVRRAETTKLVLEP
jgi:hypothetical protein